MPRFDDDYGILGGYFAEFQEQAVPLEAVRSGDSFFTTEQTTGGTKAVRMERSLVRDVQQQLNLMQAGAGNSQVWDAKTEGAWKLYVKTFKEPYPDFAVDETPPPNPLKDFKRVWLHPEAASRLRVRARNASTAAPAPAPTTAAKTTTKTTTAPKPAPAPVAPELKTATMSTFEVQSVLKRLGYPPDRISDGKFGPTTKSLWEEAAKNRSLPPAIAAKGKDIKTVIVNERTYLMLKADADAKVAPAPTTVDADVQAPPAQMDDVIARLVGVPIDQKLTPDQNMAYWTKFTEAGALPKDISYSALGYKVKQSSWTAMQSAAATKPARPQPAPGPKTDQLKLDTDELVKASTSSLPVATVRTAFRAVYANTKDGVFDVEAAGDWDHKLVTPLLKYVAAPESKFPVWQNALPTLVSTDKKTIKLIPKVADDFKKLAAAFAKATTDDAALYKGFTAVNAADVIGSINALGVSTKLFDKAGGHKELADALKTFAENTKISLPGGDIVRVNSKGAVFVKDEALSAVAKKAMEIKAAADATKAYRDKMVANAVKESTKMVPVLTLQKAWKDIVLGQESGTATSKLDPKRLAQLKTVVLSSTFDQPTRDAYTNEAMQYIIGPAVAQFQTLLKTQLPPATWDKDGLKIVGDVRSQVWNEYLGRVVSVPPGNILMPPALAQLVEVGAKHYDQNISIGDQRQQQVAAQAKVLADAVKKSTAIVSILDVQLALLQMLSTKEVSSTGVKITALADKPTKDGLFQLSAFIFPTGYSLPDTMWQSFLKQTGWIVVSGKEAARGWGGTTNYISVPPALADKVATRSGEYIALKGRPQIQITKFNTPLLVLARVPAPKKDVVDFDKEEAEARKKREAALKKQQDAEKAALEAKRKADEAARQADLAKAAGDRAAAERAAAEAARQLEEARRLAAEAAASAAAAKAAAEQQQQTAPIYEPPPVIAPGPTTQESAGGAGGASTAGGASVTGPTITINQGGGEPQVMQAGMNFTPGTLLGGAAVALLAFIASKSGDSSENEKRSRMNRSR